MSKNLRPRQLSSNPISVDSSAAATLQEIVDDEFRGCTVLAIMHKLDFVSHYDVVALLGNGTLLEFGETSSLMSRQSHFSELYRMNVS